VERVGREVGIPPAGECKSVCKGATTETIGEGSGGAGGGLPDEGMRGAESMKRIERAKAFIEKVYSEPDDEIAAVAVTRRALFNAYIERGGFTPRQAWTLLVSELSAPKVFVEINGRQAD